MNIKEARKIVNDPNSIDHTLGFAEGFLAALKGEEVMALVEVLLRARYYVQQAWDETRGTDREATAMGAADVLHSTDEALAAFKKAVQKS